jgi:hypothetical protein
MKRLNTHLVTIMLKWWNPTWAQHPKLTFYNLSTQDQSKESSSPTKIRI